MVRIESNGVITLRLALLRHDAALASSVIRALSRRKVDGFTLLIGVPILAIVARAGIAEMPDEGRSMVSLGVTWLFATVLGKVLIERLWYHRTDGVLAHEAQQTREAIAYIIPSSIFALTIGFAAIASLGLCDLRSVVLGVCCGLPSGAIFPRVKEQVRRAWSRLAPNGFRVSDRPNVKLARAAITSTAIGVAALVMPIESHLVALLVGAYVLVVVLLTAPVDAQVVRYMTLVGHSASSLLRHWLPLQIVLTSPMMIVLLIGQAWIPAAIAAISTLALPSVTAMRILAYRAFDRLIAEWSVVLIIIAAIYAGFALPPLGPIVLVAGLSWLATRGAKNRWLLA